MLIFCTIPFFVNNNPPPPPNRLKKGQMTDSYETIFNYSSNSTPTLPLFLETDIVLKFAFVKYDFCKDMPPLTLLFGQCKEP